MDNIIYTSCNKSNIKYVNDNITTGFYNKYFIKNWKLNLK